MSLMVDPSLNWIFDILAGSDWPQGDEDGLRALAEQWDDAAAGIRTAGGGFGTMINQVTGNVGGTVGRHFFRYGMQLSGFEDDFAGVASGQAQALRQYALEVENAKYSIIIQLAFTGAEILWALADPFTAPLVPEFIIEGRLAIRQIMERFFGRAAALVEVMASEAGSEVLQAGLAQLIQIGQGNRHGLDVGSLVTSAAMGAGAGVIGHRVQKLMHQYSPDFAKTWLGAAAHEAATELGVGVASLPFGGDPNGLGLSMLSGGLSGAASHAAHAVHHNDTNVTVPKVPQPAKVPTLADLAGGDNRPSTLEAPPPYEAHGSPPPYPGAQHPVVVGHGPPDSAPQPRGVDRHPGPVVLSDKKSFPFKNLFTRNRGSSNAEAPAPPSSAGRPSTSGPRPSTSSGRPQATPAASSRPPAAGPSRSTTPAPQQPPAPSRRPSLSTRPPVAGPSHRAATPSQPPSSSHRPPAAHHGRNQSYGGESPAHRPQTPQQPAHSRPEPSSANNPGDSHNRANLSPRDAEYARRDEFTGEWQAQQTRQEEARADELAAVRRNEDARRDLEASGHRITEFQASLNTEFDQQQRFRTAQYEVIGSKATDHFQDEVDRLRQDAADRGTVRERSRADHTRREDARRAEEGRREVRVAEQRTEAARLQSRDQARSVQATRSERRAHERRLDIQNADVRERRYQDEVEEKRTEARRHPPGSRAERAATRAAKDADEDARTARRDRKRAGEEKDNEGILDSARRAERDIDHNIVRTNQATDIEHQKLTANHVAERDAERTNQDRWDEMTNREQRVTAQREDFEKHLTEYHGRTDNGEHVKFNPNDIQTYRLKNKNGQTIGIGFQTKPADERSFKDWAKVDVHDGSSRHFSTPQFQMVDAQQRTFAWPSANQLTRRDTPWKDSPTPPIYVMAHANPDSFAVSLRAAAGEEPRVLRIDGRTLARLVARHRYFTDAVNGDSDRPLVLLACQSGRPDAASGPRFARHLKSLPGHENRQIYGAQGRTMIHTIYDETLDRHGHRRHIPHAVWAIEQEPDVHHGQFVPF